MTYKATLGRTAILITVVVTLLLGSLLVFSLYRIVMTTAIPEMIIFLFVGVGIVTLYLATYLYRPVRYIVDQDQFIIKRPINDITIPLEEIKDVYIVRKESMTSTERVGGNGGVFGFYGNFRNHFGTMTWYATRLKNYIMIETLNNGRVVVTPDNMDMAKALRDLSKARTIPNEYR